MQSGGSGYEYDVTDIQDNIGCGSGSMENEQRRITFTGHKAK
jgi:hypothetical protein